MKIQQFESISSSNAAFGFLCPITNIFYQFENEDTFHQFLNWIQNQNQKQANQQQKKIAHPPLTQEEIKNNFNFAGQEIMKVFNDEDLVNKSFNDGQMIEIDF